MGSIRRQSGCVRLQSYICITKSSMCLAPYKGTLRAALSTANTSRGLWLVTPFTGYSATIAMAGGRWQKAPTHHALGEALHDGGLADARLPDEHRVVLGAAAQHAHAPPDLLIPPDHLNVQKGLVILSSAVLSHVAAQQPSAY